MQALVSGARRHAPLLLMAVFLLAPVAFLPATGEWQGLRGFAVQCAAFGLLAVLLSRVSVSSEGIRRFVRTGPNIAMALFIGWVVISFFLTAPAAGQAREIQQADLMRLVAGAIVFFAVAYRCGSRDRLDLWTSLLLGGGVVASLAGLYSFSQTGAATGAFGNSQMLAGFLVPLLPVAVAFAVHGAMNGRRILALASAVMVAGTLLMTNNRSAWIGSAIGLIVMAVLAFRSTDAGSVLRQRHIWMVPALAVLVIGGAFLALSGQSGTIGERMASVAAPAADESLQVRGAMWQNAVNMVQASPLTGFGIGSFASVASDFGTGVEHRLRTQHFGPTLSTLPHNEYVQLAAELGLIGLGLYLALLFGFFYRSVTALSRVKSESRKWLLIASVAGVAAFAINDIGNPSARIAEVNLMFWLMLGLGMAASQTHRERSEAREAVPASPAGLGLARLGWQAMSAVAVLGLVGASYAAKGGSSAQVYNPPNDPEISQPTRVVFQLRGKKKTVTEQIDISNVGPQGSVLTINKVRIRGGDDQDFDIVSRVRLPANVNSGGTLRVKVRFEDGGQAKSKSRLEVTSDEGGSRTPNQVTSTNLVGLGN